MDVISVDVGCPNDHVDVILRRMGAKKKIVKIRTFRFRLLFTLTSTPVIVWEWDRYQTMQNFLTNILIPSLPYFENGNFVKNANNLSPTDQNHKHEKILSVESLKEKFFDFPKPIPFDSPSKIIQLWSSVWWWPGGGGVRHPKSKWRSFWWEVEWWRSQVSIRSGSRFSFFHSLIHEEKR